MMAWPDPGLERALAEYLSALRQAVAATDARLPADVRTCISFAEQVFTSMEAVHRSPELSWYRYESPRYLSRAADAVAAEDYDQARKYLHAAAALAREAWRGVLAEHAEQGYFRAVTVGEYLDVYAGRGADRERWWYRFPRAEDAAEVARALRERWDQVLGMADPRRTYDALGRSAADAMRPLVADWARRLGGELQEHDPPARDVAMLVLRSLARAPAGALFRLPSFTHYWGLSRWEMAEVLARLYRAGMLRRVPAAHRGVSQAGRPVRAPGYAITEMGRAAAAGLVPIPPVRSLSRGR